MIEYETPDCPHCPAEGPLITTGTFGTPVAIPFDRAGPEVGQLVFAKTETVDPPGITAGKRIEQVLEVPVTIAPGTLVDQV